MAATLTALLFPDADGADAALTTVKDLSTRALLKLHDAVVVSWSEGAARPRTRQLHQIVGPLVTSGAVLGGFAGLLAGLPAVGAAAGAATGRWMVTLSDLGIDSEFVADVRPRLRPGTSALFLMTSDALLEPVVAALRVYDFTLAATNLSDAAELRLRKMFADPPERP